MYPRYFGLDSFEAAFPLLLQLHQDGFDCITYSLTLILQGVCGIHPPPPPPGVVFGLPFPRPTSDQPETFPLLIYTIDT